MGIPGGRGGQETGAAGHADTDTTAHCQGGGDRRGSGEISPTTILFPHESLHDAWVTDTHLVREVFFQLPGHVIPHLENREYG